MSPSPRWRLIRARTWHLQVLRDVLHCTLPVELVWQGAEEMDAETLSMLQRRFGPLRGYDISAMPYPEHHRQT